MIPSLRSRLLGKERPPFEPGGRHLRVTVYCPQPDRLSEEDQFRLRFLRELAYLDPLRIVGTDRSFPWRIEIDPTPNENGVGAVHFVDPEDRYAIEHAFRSTDWSEEAIRFRLLGTGSPPDQKTCALALRLPVLEAHTQTHRDLFITSHPDFLTLRSRILDANIKDLREGLRIVGLYLRWSGDFTIRASQKTKRCFYRHLFYWVLCRHRLPAMWRYFSACLQYGRETHTQNKELGDLAGTILNRCVRVLQARDEVGFRFYQRQDYTTRDEMLYHFDYLTILLSGTFDAEARIARQVYEITKVPARSTSFRNHDFRKALRDAGGQSLADVVNDVSFQAFQRFLGVLRNSIHSVGLHGLGVSRAGEQESSLGRVFEGDKDIWEAAVALGSCDDIGVTKHKAGSEVAVEPYTCAVRLCELGFRYVNHVAEATDVERLLAAGPTAELLAGPPEDSIFGSNIRRRIDALG